MPLEQAWGFVMRLYRLGYCAVLAAGLLTGDLAFAAASDIAGNCLASNAFREIDKTMERCAAALETPGVTSEDRAKFHTQRGLAFHWTVQPAYSNPEFNEALKLDPSNQEARLRRGWAHLQAQRPSLSYQDFTDVLAADSKNSSALYGIASIYFGTSEHGKAVKLLEQALQIDPDYHAARSKLADHFTYHAGDNRRALQEYDRILGDTSGTLDAVPFWSVPPSPAGFSFRHVVQEKKATALLRARLASEAQNLLEPLVKRFPGVANLYVLRGNAKHALGEYEAALSDAEKSLSLSPYSLSGQELGMNALFWMRRYEEALKSANKILSVSFHERAFYAQALRTRAIILKSQGQYSEAKADFEQVMRMDKMYRVDVIMRLKEWGYYDGTPDDEYNTAMSNGLDACLVDPECYGW